MMKSNIANKKPSVVLHSSIKKWAQLIFLRMYDFFCDSDNRRQDCWEGNFGEQKNPHSSPDPSIQSWGVCCFLQAAQTSAYHYIAIQFEGYEF